MSAIYTCLTGECQSSRSHSLPSAILASIPVASTRVKMGPPGTPSRDLTSFGSVIRSRMAPLASELNQNLATDTTSARDRARLFHMAWDVSCSSFNSRLVLYDRMFGGNPLRNAMTLFNTYDQEPFRKQVQNFLESDD